MGTIQAFLKDRADQTPQIEGLVGGSERLSFKEYNEKVNQLAHYLLKQNVQRGDRIAIVCKNNYPFPIIMMAAIKIGAIAVPLNRQMTAYEMEGVIKKCQPKVLFYDEEYMENLSSVNEKQMIPSMILTGIGMETVPAFNDLLAGQPTDEPTVSIDSEDPAIILFTSGTTGNSKGCVITHQNLYAWFTETGSLRDTKPGMRYLGVHPFYHMSSCLNILNGVYYGITVVCLSDADPEAIWDMIDKEKINTMMGFPSTYTYMLEELKKQNRTFESFKTASCGGTKVPASLIRDYAKYGISLTQGYGSTEAWAVSVWHPDMGYDKIDSVGKPIQNVEVKIVDPESHQELPAGEVGEIIVKSPYVFKGYWKDPEATKEVLQNGWFYMGDAGKFDEDGFLYIMDRYKDVIVYGGENIFSGEVEKVIHDIDGVLEAAVVGIPDDFWGEVPRAYIVKESGSPLTEEDILNYCKERLSEYKIPEVEFVDRLPKNSLGKILKRELKELALQKQ
ncbi:long-chain acyl-CoA synthetase [Scopulibacillus daqui]|uniref:Long-chain acyl-CoA synthetase n=1 Tax=Scopulibacillus daqui TaxID=1469162 RepID=A0ABS2Q3Y2_9BACL|nr:class I adenylate-forming enzyme family protein [Scopulibacillus daqui]MBM7646192.1 long-chain acyl-CoA synthetase [Scopulibacillus daqui]